MKNEFIRALTDAEWLALDDAVQAAYGAYMAALVDGDAADIAKAHQALQAAYAARDGGK